MSKERIFLSAVTQQFKACRDALRDDLEAVGAEVRVQENFTQSGGTLLEKLEDYIASCDRVIVLVGDAYGWAPPPAATPEQAPARSYTQWEYHFAMGERLDGTQAAGKPVYVYFAAPAYLEQHPVEQSESEAQRQQQFIEAIIASDKDRNEFDSIDNLARLVLRDGFRLSSADRLLPHNLPYDSLGSLFKGRADIIAAMRANLCADTEQATAIVAKQAIHGLGGIGKTRLAVEYAWQHRTVYAACLFLTADSRENLERNLAELCGARVLNLPEQTAQEQELQVAAVLRWFGQHSDWLLILDNVDTAEAAQAVDRLLPALQNGHVLITSRRTDWSNSIHTLPLDTLSEDAAVAFLLEKTAAKRTRTDTDAAEARTLAQTLGGLALALEQAGAFINKKRLSLEAYQQRWNQQEQKLRDWYDARTMHYPRSLAVTWEASFEQLSPEAQVLLNVLCWFASDPIPRAPVAAAFDPETLATLIGETEPDMAGETQAPDFEDLLDEMETLSLLKWETGNHGFSVHRLVQEITQTRLDDSLRSASLWTAVGLINEALPADPPPDDVRAWPIWDPLRPHLERLIPTADEASIADPTARLMNNFGLYLKAKGLYREAEPTYRRVLAIDEASLGPEHPRVATDLTSLAALLQTTNRLAEAEPLMRRALAIDEANFGAEHPRVAIDLNNLAVLLGDTNRRAEAEPLMRRALAIDEASLGPEHTRVATDLNNLAELLRATNRLAEAEPLYRRALAIVEANFGAEHPNVASQFNSLAVLLGDTNRRAEAEPLMRRALAIDEASYGPEHPKVAIDLNNFAGLLQATNRRAEAEPLHRRALAINEASYGPEHPNVAIDLNNLAQLLQATNRLAEAEPLMRRALAIDEASFGPEHPRVAIDLDNLAQLLRDTNRPDQAEPLMRRALAIDEASLGPEHTRVATGLNNLAQLLQATNRLAEAKPLSRQMLEILLLFTIRTGHEHPHLKTAIGSYMGLLAAMGHDEEESIMKFESLFEAVKRKANL